MFLVHDIRITETNTLSLVSSREKIISALPLSCADERIQLPKHCERKILGFQLLGSPYIYVVIIAVRKV